MNLNQITIYSSDMLKAAEFYKTLGFSLIVDSMPRYARFECPHGDATFSLHSSDTSVRNNSLVLYFECADVDNDYDRLTRLGVNFLSQPHDQPWLWREAELEDPDGNKLIIYSAGENRKNPPWRVDHH